jgi:predicted RecB family endonuclease
MKWLFRKVGIREVKKFDNKVNKVRETEKQRFEIDDKWLVCSGKVDENARKLAEERGIKIIDKEKLNLFFKHYKLRPVRVSEMEL